jgi:hypothetical protein
VIRFIDEVQNVWRGHLSANLLEQIERAEGVSRSLNE